MKTSILVRNTEGQLFEFDNTQKCSLNIAKRFNYHCKGVEHIEENDIIYFNEREIMILVHKSKTEEESHFIIKAIRQKLKEKSDKLMEIQVVKKIEGLHFSIVENLKKELRDNYFEINIKDILKNYKVS